MPDDAGAAAVDTSQQQTDTGQQQGAQDNNQQQQAQVTPFNIPEELRFKTDERTGVKTEKGWYSKIVDDKGNIDPSKLVGELDNLNKLKGQKTVPFDWANAKPDEIEAHIASLKPESHDVYDFFADMVKAGKVAESNVEPFQKLFQECGIPKAQAVKLAEGYTAWEAQQTAAMTSKEGFEESLKGYFGDKFAEPASKVGSVLDKTLSTEEKALLDKMPNVFLGLVYKTVDKIMADYGITESALGAGSSTGGVGGSIASLQKEVTESFNALTAMKGTHYDESAKSTAVKRYNDAQLALARAQGELK